MSLFEIANVKGYEGLESGMLRAFHGNVIRYTKAINCHIGLSFDQQTDLDGCLFSCVLSTAGESFWEC